MLNDDRDNNSVLPSKNINISTLTILNDDERKSNNRKQKFKEPFDEEKEKIILKALVENEQSESTGFLFSLLEGLSTGEMTALKYGDIDFINKSVRVNKAKVTVNRKLKIDDTKERNIPLTETMLSILKDRNIDKKNENNFVFTDSECFPETNRTVENVFRKIVNLDNEVCSSSLQSAFIKNCLEANLNIETVSYLIGCDRASVYRYFGKYIKAKPADIHRLDETAKRFKLQCHKKQLNLLILGAGSHGHGVKEIAEMLGIFQKVSFLDDNLQGDDIVGKCTDYEKYIDEYPVAFPAFGSNELREKWTKLLQNQGFMLPVLIHPSAIVSLNVTLKEGTVIMAQSTVNAGAYIGKSCIIAPNSMIGFGSKIGDFAHIDCGAIVIKDSDIPSNAVIESGMVYKK